MKTAEQIADLTDHLYGVNNIRAINKIYRSMDESHLWPISGKFNATERAIRRVRNNSDPMYGLEYCYAIEAELTAIVNGEIG